MTLFVSQALPFLIFPDFPCRWKILVKQLAIYAKVSFDIRIITQGCGPYHPLIWMWESHTCRCCSSPHQGIWVTTGCYLQPWGEIFWRLRSWLFRCRKALAKQADPMQLGYRQERLEEYRNGTLPSMRKMTWRLSIATWIIGTGSAHELSTQMELALSVPRGPYDHNWMCSGSW